MSDEDMVEAVARAILECMNQAPVPDEEWRRVMAGDANDVATLMSWGRAALSVIESRVRAEERERAARIAEAEMAKCNLYVERKLGGEQGIEKNTARYQTARSILAAIRSGDEG